MSLTKHRSALDRVAGGNHLTADNDEPERYPDDAERIAADLARDQDKGPKLAARGDDYALQLQLNGHIGWLPR